MALLDDQLEQMLFAYIPGLEDQSIKEIYELFEAAGWRKTAKAAPDPDERWRKEAEEKNARLAAKYGPKTIVSVPA